MYLYLYFSPSIEKLAQTLEIRDQEEADLSPPLSLHSSSASATVAHSQTIDSLTHHIEVQVLESGQVARSSGAAGFLSTESTSPILARRDTVASRVRDTTAESHVEPMTASSTPHSKRGSLVASLQRRAAPNSNSGNSRIAAVGGSSFGSGKATQEDQVEVDGQFDMPILDTMSSETVSTATSAVMTFVMTSEGLSQTMSPEREKQHQTSPASNSVRTVGLQSQHTPTTLSGKPPPNQATPIAPPTPPVAVATSGNEQAKEKESADAATQTTNAKVRSEVGDRTPLIIRRSRVGKVQKSTNTKQQSDTDVKLVEPTMGNGNETGQPACNEVQIQTQSLSGMRISSVGVQATEGIAKEPDSANKEKVPSQTPRRSTRKSTHKLSPEKNESAVGTVTPLPPAKISRISPTGKSPAKTSPVVSDGTQNSPRIRTRSATKRCGLDEEQATEGRDTPPAKRSRKATTERPGGKHPQLWGVNEVAEFVNGFQRDCTNTFREHVSWYN